MSREQERTRRKLEKNPIGECNRIRDKYCPGLFHDFAQAEDPRNQSYTEYAGMELLGTMFYKGIAGLTSMQSMTYEFNQESVAGNLCRFMGTKEREYLPHAVTLNEYFERLDPGELQKIQQKQVYGLIRSKAFYDARFQKKWLVIVDGTQTYSGSRKLNDGCLERRGRNVVFPQFGFPASAILTAISTTPFSFLRLLPVTLPRSSPHPLSAATVHTL